MAARSPRVVILALTLWLIWDVWRASRREHLPFRFLLDETLRMIDLEAEKLEREIAERCYVNSRAADVN